LPEDRVAIGTMAGGAVIINKRNDKIVHTINYSTGLPGDEIYALAKDKNDGLWISHNQGITRASLNLPVKNFATYPGLKGRPLKTVQIDSSLFVATTNFIYYLSKEKSYQRKTITMKEEISEKERKKQQKKQEGKEKPDNFFEKVADKLFNKEEEEEKKEETEKERQYKYRKKDIYSLESTSYEYKEIEGIKGRYNQLLPFRNGLCVATNNGLFYINDQKESSRIIEQTHIYHIAEMPESNRIVAATQNGIREIKYQNQSWSEHNPAPSLKNKIFSVAIEDSTTVWASGEDILYRIKEDDDTSKVNKYKIQTRYPEKYKVAVQNDSIFLLLNEGIYKYHENTDSFRPTNKYNNNDNKFQNLTYDITQPTRVWVNNKEDWNGLTKEKQENQLLNSYLDLFDNIEDIFYKKDRLWLTTKENIYRIILDEKTPKNKNFKAYFSAILEEEGKNRLQIHDFNFNEESVALEFKVAAPNYIGQNKTKYQFYIEGMMDEWSEWRTSPSIQIFTKKGSYDIKARAKNIWGETQETQSIHFDIPPPFTETIWFYSIIGLTGILLIYILIKIREKKLQRDKKILEQKVQARTKTIEEQKEEIKSQRDEIEEKKNNLQIKNQEITDSIEYAARIQSALLPLTDYFYDAFSDYFILFKPRDIVSGDFYWITQKDKKVYITAADCTGHGVPGAFMSMLGISFLNEIVSDTDKYNSSTAADILNELRKIVKESLHQTNKKGDSKDGMDMAFCIIDYENNQLHYAGAHNPLLIFRNSGEFEEIKADRMPIGAYLKKEEKPFTNHTIDIQTGDSFYMFSDGYPDQFGGPEDKKFKKKNLKRLLSDIKDRSMEEQHRLLDHNFEEWKGDNIQIDDVILLG
ncbi:MAG: SpoIIE family protein phosphatase, partial [Bacteroidota bacterium]